jgi:hypothetical protein
VTVRILELLFGFLQTRASYTNRVWSALLFPVVAGTLFGLSMRTKVEGVLLGMLVVVFYTASQWIWQKYLRQH